MYIIFNQIQSGENMKHLLSIALTLSLSTHLMAEANIPLDKKEQKKILKQLSEKSSPYNAHEHFPKEYLLIPKNLPFLLNLTLHHPQSSELNLTKEQLKKLTEIKSQRKPEVLKAAKEIKELELKLVEQMLKEGKKASEVESLVDTIAKKKAEITKKHLLCIKQVRDILTLEQQKIVDSYATAKRSHQKHSHRKKSHHKVQELFSLPHPVKVILANKEELNITKEQEKQIEEKMLAVYPTKIHGSMDKAESIEAKIKAAVLTEQKSKEDVKSDIEALIEIKRTLSYDHIDALNTLGKILTKEQFDKVVELSAKKKHKHHKSNH